MRLDGKVALVTGGSNGIGAATVRSLASSGAKVAIGFHSGKARAEALRAELPGEGHGIVPLVLEDGASAVAAADFMRQTYGRADILVNSAGFTKPVPHKNLDALDNALMDEVLIANVRGPFAMIRALVPLMRESATESHDGVIVNVSSIAAFTGSGSSIAYCAAKAALDTMTMSLARVLGPEIRVLCVSPGAVATDFVAGRDRSELERQAASTPSRRVTEAEDVALAIMACVTHLRASTGVRIVVDGGRHL